MTRLGRFAVQFKFFFYYFSLFYHTPPCMQHKHVGMEIIKYTKDKFEPHIQVTFFNLKLCHQSATNNMLNTSQVQLNFNGYKSY